MCVKEIIVWGILWKRSLIFLNLLLSKFLLSTCWNHLRFKLNFMFVLNLSPYICFNFKTLILSVKRHESWLWLCMTIEALGMKCWNLVLNHINKQFNIKSHSNDENHVWHLWNYKFDAHLVCFHGRKIQRKKRFLNSRIKMNMVCSTTQVSGPPTCCI